MHPNDSLGSMESLRDTHQRTGLPGWGWSLPRAEITAGSSAGTEGTVLRSPTGKLKRLALILSLLSATSNSVLVLSAQSSISQFSLCPNVFGGRSLTGLLLKGGTIGLPEPYSTIIHCAPSQQTQKTHCEPNLCKYAFLFYHQGPVQLLYFPIFSVVYTNGTPRHSGYISHLCQCQCFLTGMKLMPYTTMTWVPNPGPGSNAPEPQTSREA